MSLTAKNKTKDICVNNDVFFTFIFMLDTHPILFNLRLMTLLYYATEPLSQEIKTRLLKCK